jgi:hypothetical protein
MVLGGWYWIPKLDLLQQVAVDVCTSVGSIWTSSVSGKAREVAVWDEGIAMKRRTKRGGSG